MALWVEQLHALPVECCTGSVGNHSSGYRGGQMLARMLATKVGKLNDQKDAKTGERGNAFARRHKSEGSNPCIGKWFHHMKYLLE